MTPRAPLTRLPAALGVGDEEEAALLRQLRDCPDDDTDALMRELEAATEPRRARRAASTPHADAACAADDGDDGDAGADVESLTAAVAAARREAVAHKQAGRLHDARAALRASKALQAQLEAARQAESELQQDPELAAELQLLMAAHAAPLAASVSAEEPRGDAPAPAVAAHTAAVAGVDAARDADAAAPVAAAAAAHEEAQAAPEAECCVAAEPQAAEAPPTREAVLAAKREAVAFKRAGQLPEARAALARAKDIERRLALLEAAH